MNWILPVYLVVLAYASVNQDRAGQRAELRKAWFWLGMVFMAYAIISSGLFAPQFSYFLLVIRPIGIWLMAPGFMMPEPLWEFSPAFFSASLTSSSP